MAGKVVRAALALAVAATLTAWPDAEAGKRDASAVRAFRARVACPATGMTGRMRKCPGYEVDHVVPLCAGGRDHPTNMQWLTIDAHRRKTRLDVAACRDQSPPD